MLPNRTGGWLIQQAEAEGLLDATPALLVTAHPNPARMDGVEIIPKPFDLDDLVDRVKQKLEGNEQKLEANEPSRPPARRRKPVARRAAAPAC